MVITFLRHPRGRSIAEMINIEIPNHHTVSSEGTPHLTINHEATVDLDSSSAFEGENLNSKRFTFF